MANVQVQVPDPHPALPVDVQQAWKKTYTYSFRELKRDKPQSGDDQCHRYALRAANKSLRVIEPKSYEDAIGLEKWQVIHREYHEEKPFATENGTGAALVLKVVTMDGKKFAFPVPESERAKAEQAGIKRFAEKAALLPGRINP
ncbi:MAG TPA: hypothetical protein VJN64_04925 [Terriglobales bacterium]|nr:hypothetical protein [Terriglobales bacterium]